MVGEGQRQPLSRLTPLLQRIHSQTFEDIRLVEVLLSNCTSHALKRGEVIGQMI
jgi:hypothetical protein